MNGERNAWLGIVGGAVVIGLGARRGGSLGTTLALAGLAVATNGLRQLGAADGFHHPREPMPLRRDPAEFSEWKDRVQEASEESFPASDPPSHTPTTGVGFA